MNPRSTPIGFAFVTEPLDRADALRGDAAALARLANDCRCIVLDARGEAALDGEGRWQLESHAPDDAVFLGLAGDGVAWFAAQRETSANTPHRIDLRRAAAQWSAFDSTAFAQARAVLHWRATHHFCAVCGHALVFSRGGWQGDCLDCGRTHYPRTDPAIIVAVSDGERLLLGRQATWPARRYSTLAGFVEPGESLEQTVAREVFEESRVRVRRCRYLASQPWPFPGSLMLGFLAEAHADEPVAQVDELEDVRWFTRDVVLAALAEDREDAPLRLSPPMSISRWLIERWANGAPCGDDSRHSTS